MTRAAENTRLGKKTILVVDDEKDLVDLITYNLTRHGYAVLSAFSGTEALEIAERESPDLIVLDLMLPGLDGTEVARRLKADPRTSNIPIVMLTAKGEETDVVVGVHMIGPDAPEILQAAAIAVKAGLKKSDFDAVVALHPTMAEDLVLMR